MSNDSNSSLIQNQISVKTILVVEDDEAIGDFIVEALKQETAHQALLATDGASALQVAKNLKPNLLLLDYRLPDMNGIELYDRLHMIEGFGEIPAIIMSASLPRYKLEQRKLTRIEKPFELGDLLRTIEELLV
jgi:CheY-like chemotaxis protein